MICYRCNHEAGNLLECPFCGADLKIFIRIKRLSNMYYNDALEKVEVRNLSGAIISLKKSLKFNKYNIDARNLLGLIYYEMGEVVEALSEWVISRSYQEKDNLASRYLEDIRENRTQLEAINQTIKKYNQALLYCKQDSRDMAIIQLKKVLSLNPKLVKAHQLLALLYLQEGRLEDAKKTLRNAGKIDANNTITLRYLKEVNVKLKEKGFKKKKEEDPVAYQSGNDTIIMPKQFQNVFFMPVVVYLLIGLVLGGLAIGFLVVPGVEKKAKLETKKQMLEASDMLSANSQLIDLQNIRIKELEAELTSLQGENGELPAQLAAYESLIVAYSAYVDKDYVLAGTSLETIDSSLLSDTAIRTYNTLTGEVSKPYYNILYQEGYQNYNNEKYTEAIEVFLKIVSKDLSYRDGYATYYLAQAYRKSGNLEAAKPYYQYIIENYPGTQRAETAKNYVK